VIKKTYDSVRWEVLCNILTECDVPVKLVRLIKICVRETYRRAQVGGHVSGMIPIKFGLNEGDCLSPLLFNLT
jgi:hypothetical protein